MLVKEGQIHNYQEMFLTSKFCIAPYGYGWGLRLAISVAHGCIPVIIQVSALPIDLALFK